VKRIIAELNPVLRCWRNYFRTGNADGEFNKVDRFVWTRLCRWHYRRGGQRHHEAEILTWRSAVRYGPVSLAGHGAIPGASDTKKIIVKPCAENGTHV